MQNDFSSARLHVTEHTSKAPDRNNNHHNCGKPEDNDSSTDNDIAINGKSDEE